jgi:hypothetical protein
MILTEGLHTYTHSGHRTTDTKIINLAVNGVTIKFKFSYEAFNAGENFNGEAYDNANHKLNPVFNINDLGYDRECNAYAIYTEEELKGRIATLTREGIKFIKSLYQY